MKKYSEYRNSGIPWIGDIPLHWNIQRGKNVLTLLDRPIKNTDEVITCFRDGEVTLRKNRREEGFTLSFQEIGYQGIEPGDLVVHGMDGFAGAIGISDSRGKATPVLNVMDSLHNKRYLMYYLRTAAYKDVFMSLSTGIRIRSCDLRWNKLSVFPFILPERDEQDRIVEYIDDRLSQIDSLISETKMSIEEYKAWKISVIYEAVTKGLDPNADMHDSGVEWIGKIPSDWTMKPFKRIVLARDGGAWGDEPSTQDEKKNRICLRIADFDFDGGRFKKHDIELYTKRKYTIDQMERLVLQKGDLLVEKSGGGEKTPVGRLVMFDLEIDALYANFMDRIRVDSDVALPEYIAYYWKAMYYKTVTTAYIKQTIGIQNLNLSALLEKEYVLIPEITLQENIIKHLDSECKKIDQVISEKNMLVSDLEAYKKSLIFEVITGKKKVC